MRLTLPTSYRFGSNAGIVLWYSLSKGLTLALFGLVFNLYIYAEGYDREFIGLLNALPAITSLLVAVPAGLLGDRIGYRTLLLVTGFLNPLTQLGLAASSAPLPLAFFQLSNGVISTLYWVSAVPLLAGCASSERRVQLFSLNSFLLWGAGSLGYVLGGTVVGLMATVLHQSPHAVAPLRAGMVAVGIVGLLGALPLPWLRLDPRPPAHERTHSRYDLSLYASLLGPDLLLTCGGGAVAGFIGLYLTLRFSVQPGALGTFLTVSGLIGGVLVLLAPRFAQRLGTTRAAVLLQAAGVPAIVLLTLAPTQALAMVGEVLRNGVRSMGDPVYSAFVMSRVPADQRATISGLYGTTWSLGFAIGPAVSGAVQQQAGFTPAFLLGACSMSLGVFLLYLLFLRREPPGTGP